ncbi:hypothetical protein GCM10022217_15920 [Chryseobacterium ginsenosidimutans]|uniref:hypothetical protein n=1 Tax=Chryseobacterium ginsenosidimutans TaxID=687846 RepID=UPI0031E33E33
MININPILEIIDSYEKDDAEYSNDLLAMVTLLPFDDLPDFEILLKKAQEENKKLLIDENELKDKLWDSLLIENIKIKQ